VAVRGGHTVSALVLVLVWAHPATPSSPLVEKVGPIERRQLPWQRGPGSFLERRVFPVLIRARSTPIINASGASGPSGGSLIGGNNILPWPRK